MEKKHVKSTMFPCFSIFFLRILPWDLHLSHGFWPLLEAAGSQELGTGRHAMVPRTMKQGRGIGYSDFIWKHGVRACVCVYIYIYVYMYMEVYVNICTYVSSVKVCKYIYIWLNVYIHHTYVYIYILSVNIRRSSVAEFLEHSQNWHV